MEHSENEFQKFKRNFKDVCGTLERISKKKFWVAGAGKSGLAAAKLLNGFGVNTFLTESGSIKEDVKEQLKALKIEFEENGHNLEKFRNECDCLVLSPGILQTQGIAFEARRNNILVVSEIELASWFLPDNAKVLGITGTNGKSTTTWYLSQLIQRDGKTAVACGNIGEPLSQAVVRAPETQIFVVELSSYQLENTYSKIFDGVAILNLQNDHLARYETLAEYLKAKWRILYLLRDTGKAFIDAEVLRNAAKLGLILPPRSETVALGDKDNLDAGQKAKNLGISGQGLPVPTYGNLSLLSLNALYFPTEIGHVCYLNQKNKFKIALRFSNRKEEFVLNEPCLPGAHNLENLLAAAGLARTVDVSLETIVKQWESSTTKFVPLAHRLEKVGERFLKPDGAEVQVIIVNDSKATNVESTLVAVKSFSQNVRLLLGGEPKGDSYLPLMEFKNKPIVKVYPFGKAGVLITNELVAHKSLLSAPLPNMLSAARLALSEAEDGDIILLSPACASFDEFKNFEHRGDIFKEWAKSCLVF